MNPPVENFPALACQSRLLLLLWRFSECEILLLDVIISSSFGLGRGQGEAFIESLSVFTDRTGIDRSNARKILRRLAQARVIQADTARGRYAFLPDTSGWDRALVKPWAHSPRLQQLMLSGLVSDESSLQTAIASLSRQTTLGMGNDLPVTAESAGSESERNRLTPSAGPSPPVVSDTTTVVRPTTKNRGRLPQQSVVSDTTAAGHSISGYPELPDLPGRIRTAEAVEAIRISAPPATTPQRPTAHEEYTLDKLRELLGEDELRRNGGYWRLRYREKQAQIETGIRALIDKIDRLKRGVAGEKPFRKTRAAWLSWTVNNPRPPGWTGRNATNPSPFKKGAGTPATPDKVPVQP